MIEYHNNSNCGGTPHDFALLITNILMAKMYIFVHYIMLCKIICYHIVGMAAILKNGWHWLAVWNIGWLTFYLLTCVIGKGFFFYKKSRFLSYQAPRLHIGLAIKGKKLRKKILTFQPFELNNF